MQRGTTVKIALGVLFGIGAASAPAHAGTWDWSCDAKAPREATVDASGAKQVRVLARAGELKIHGRQGASSVTVQGTACASNEGALADVKLVAERRGTIVYIEASIPENNWFGGQGALDLDIEVPASIALEVDDGSGEASVTGVASLKIEDGSGELTIADVAGAVSVDDGSGSLKVTGVGGEVRIKDGSGEITIRDVGSVRIDEDGSGGVQIANVKGDVLIDDDGSGSIDVREVAGNFTVEDDGSGSIEHHGVHGRVRIPSDK
jgi:hypothetical protein